MGIANLTITGFYRLYRLFQRFYRGCRDAWNMSTCSGEYQNKLNCSGEYKKSLGKVGQISGHTHDHIVKAFVMIIKIALLLLILFKLIWAIKTTRKYHRLSAECEIFHPKELYTTNNVLHIWAWCMSWLLIRMIWMRQINVTFYSALDRVFAFGEEQTIDLVVTIQLIIKLI